MWKMTTSRWGEAASSPDFSQTKYGLDGDLAPPVQPAWTKLNFNSRSILVSRPKPLRAIASSGEMARVMLALKTVLAAEDEIPVLIFDEVDANVGGETANAVGEKMKQIATKRQVLCITHLPQVAASADAHYVVIKQIRDGRTISESCLAHEKGARDRIGADAGRSGLRQQGNTLKPY